MLCFTSHQCLLILGTILNYEHAIQSPGPSNSHAPKNLFCIQNSPKEVPHLHSALIPGATFLSPPPANSQKPFF